MKFGVVPTSQAVGAILANAMMVGDPAQTVRANYRIAKGTFLTAQHIADLIASGHTEVIVARLGPGDLHEDDAATRLGAALCGTGRSTGLRAARAATGRVNLYAVQPGIVEIDAAKVDAINAVDPMITLATVPRWQRLGEGGMVATIKIISYGVPETDIARACSLASGTLRLRPAVMRSASLIETQVSGDTPTDKGRRALRTRLDRFGVTLTDPRVVVPHTAAALAQALSHATGDVVFILTASATSDIADVGPSGVLQAGGQVLHFGMPVDPGNLLFLGALGQNPVIGLPGCARSPALNGADWVLERVLCGVPLSGQDLTAMGVGGLLKEIPSRPRPRQG